MEDYISKVLWAIASIMVVGAAVFMWKYRNAPIEIRKKRMLIGCAGVWLGVMLLIFLWLEVTALMLVVGMGLGCLFIGMAIYMGLKIAGK